ncbi:TrkH family potassium uptake protein [Eubacteriales bacterium OttesenSCG-928-M02]|nr:TrkH family potassium uptake protein [Eubacteriales bacterium OttesenSCG-928-M02]
MNYRMIGFLIGRILLVEGIFLLPAFFISLGQGERAAGNAILITIALLVAFGVALSIKKPKRRTMHLQDSFVMVALSWVLVSLFGALPFTLSGAIPNYIDAVFEAISGFTTTGGSILTDVEAMPMGLLYWRSFTHWLGGMGVLVFLLAIMPNEQEGGEGLSIMQAESTGPSVGKLVPRLRDTAKILYLIYCGMTIIQLVLLLLGQMPLFDAVTLTFGTAGTGGFAVRADGLASYSTYCQVVITIFMALFGVSFNLYHAILIGAGLKVLKNEELRVYFALMLGSALLIALNILPSMANFGKAFHHASFQVSSIMTTTGYSTVDFNLWPTFSKMLLVILMFFGACAGSTGGGMKISRLIILIKSAKNAIGQIVHPNKVRVVQMNGETVDDSVVKNTQSFLVIYCLIAMVSMLLIGLLDNLSTEATATSVIACLNNIGPGLDSVGPMGNFYHLSYPSKIILSLNMLFGRLEIFPMLLLFSPAAWRGNRRKNRRSLD